MITYPSPGQQQVVYQADPTTVDSVRRVKDRLHSIGRQHINRRVRMQTIDGRVYEGVIVNVDACFVYLQTPMPAVPYRSLYPSSYYDNVILPLVLYELLVITLLYT